MGFGWYVIRTMPRMEFSAERALCGDGYEIFSPTLDYPTGNLKATGSPLFPGYLFIRCDPESDGWPSFRPAHQVIGWVKFAGSIPIVPDSIIEQLLGRGGNSGPLLWEKFKKGDKVFVSSSGFECFAEVLEEAKSSHSTSLVLLNFMSRVVEAKVPWEDLSLAVDHPNEGHKLPRRTRGRGRRINNHYANRNLSEIAG